MPTSLDYIYSGTNEQFIDQLIEEVYRHSALNHPYLERLANGRLPDVPGALRDYAHQYSIYSDWFVKYLDAVIGNLESQAHRDKLLENVEEENGNPNSSELVDQPHVKIFADFKRQIGVTDEFAAGHPISQTALIWRDLFLQKCKSDVNGVGLGAIGLATEFIVPRIYPYIIESIERHTDLGQQGSLFFRIHVECDAEHGDDVVEVTTDVASDISTREAIRFGALSALNLRHAFWDSQLARAMQMKAV